MFQIEKFRYICAFSATVSKKINIKEEKILVLVFLSSLIPAQNCHSGID